MANTALIFYGRGAELGNFKVMSDSLAKDLRGRYPASGIVQENVELRSRFFDYLRAPPFASSSLIGEFHVFSHAIGGGLFLAYHDANRQRDRDHAKETARRRGTRLTFFEVLGTELGTVFTDDLRRRPFLDMRDAIRRNFAPDATIKIWGCNSGVDRWVYHDDGATGAVGPIEEYYFRALNEQWVPKPSVAQAFADFFGRRTFGAESGSHIEVKDGGRWMKTSQYRSARGRWPGPRLRHRLVPDRGVYREYRPSP
jgi:hypothetical protein